MHETTDAVADYEGAGFRGRLGWGASPAVVVIDLCRAYLDPTSPLYAGIEAEVACAAALVAGARARAVPVLFTRVELAPGGVDGGLFSLKVPALRLFERGHPLAAFLDDPAPRPGEVVVTKQYASAFFGTSLAPTLLRLGIDTVVDSWASPCIGIGLAVVRVPRLKSGKHRAPHQRWGASQRFSSLSVVRK